MKPFFQIAPVVLGLLQIHQCFVYLLLGGFQFIEIFVPCISRRKSISYGLNQFYFLITQLGCVSYIQHTLQERKEMQIKPPMRDVIKVLVTGSNCPLVDQYISKFNKRMLPSNDLYNFFSYASYSVLIEYFQV